MEIVAIAAVIVVLLVVLVVVIARSGDHEALDEATGGPVRDRPAGPGAEDQNSAVPGQPTTGPEDAERDR